MAEFVHETERLRLRSWTPKLQEEFVRRLNTPAVMRWLGGVQDQAAYDRGWTRIAGYERDYVHNLLAVERKSDGELLGFCGLKRVNSSGAGTLTGEFEIGWRLREDAWGQGYAKEAAIASLDLAFGRFGARFVIAITVHGNAHSQGLMKRLGMVRREDLDFIDPTYGPDLNPSIIYGIEAADWPKARAAALA